MPTYLWKVQRLDSVRIRLSLRFALHFHYIYHITNLLTCITLHSPYMYHITFSSHVSHYILLTCVALHSHYIYHTTNLLTCITIHSPHMYRITLSAHVSRYIHHILFYHIIFCIISYVYHIIFSLNVSHYILLTNISLHFPRIYSITSIALHFSHVSHYTYFTGITLKSPVKPITCA